MKRIKRLTADQQRLVEENLAVVEPSCGLMSERPLALRVSAMKIYIKRAVSGSAMRR